jgi:hypothetical protein
MSTPTTHQLAQEAIAKINAAHEAELTTLRQQLDERTEELTAERNLHGQTRVVVEELNIIATDLRNAGQPQFIRSEAIRLLREEVCALKSSLATAEKQRDEARAKQPLNTHVRLFDLVRQQRSELHQADLITDDEYVWLSGGAKLASDPKGGSPSPRRLEDYDEMRSRLTAADELAKALGRTTSYIEAQEFTAGLKSEAAESARAVLAKWHALNGETAPTTKEDGK